IIVASISSSVAEQPVGYMMQKRPGSINYDRMLHRFRWEVLVGRGRYTPFDATETCKVVHKANPQGKEL
ncbi:MAG TPA: hypothetical protein VGT82_10765, partial [Ktedonobacteraceae bacterium]|nr:hypothetical protein [Ktedonobacteraceae bacterium]